MTNIIQISFLFLSCFLGFICALIFFYFIFKTREIVTIKNNIKKSTGIDKNIEDIELCCTGFAKKIILDLLKISYKINNSLTANSFLRKFIKTNKLSYKVKELCLHSNMPSVFGRYALIESQIKYAIILGCIGCVLGFIFSNILMFVLMIVGMLIGFFLPTWALKKEKEARLESLEKNLPEMLDVLALGMRSGLTFDRAIEIYSLYFDNEFSKNCAQAKMKWDGAVCSREESLRQLAKTYDSFLLTRVIESIIRSLRYGSSLTEILEQAATEARNIFKEKQEEIVSKAPVKMMVPTGTLILPAMLILVLGPVILELISGF